MSVKRKRLLMVVFILFFALNLSGCKLTVNIKDSVGGAVYSNDGAIDCPNRCSHEYEGLDAEVTLFADPDSGYVFAGFENPGLCDNQDESSLDNGECRLTMNDNHTIVAVFRKEGDSSNQKPVLSFLQPKAGKVDPDLGVVVDAHDSDGNIEHVLLYINDNLVRREGAAPFEWGTANHNQTDNALLNLSPGEYQLRAVAIDNAGASASITRSVTVSSQNISGDDDFFTIALFPDTQKLTKNSSNAEWLFDTGDFIAANKDVYHIRAALHVGDIVQVPTLCDQQSRWDRMLTTTHDLADAGVPFIPACGNHDGCADNYGVPSDFNAQFTDNTSCGRMPYNVTRQNPLYRDSYSQYQPGVGVENAYYVIEQSGKKFIILSLRFSPDNGALQKDWDNWTHKVLKDHSDKYAIILTHEFQNEAGKPNVHRNNARRHENVHLVLQGHRHGGRERSVIDSGNGHKIQKFIYAFAHHEEHLENDAAAVRLFTFNLTKNRVDMKTYSVRHDKWLTDQRACDESNPDYERGHCDEYSWNHQF